MISEDDQSVLYVMAKLGAWLMVVMSPILPVLGTMAFVVAVSFMMELFLDFKEGRGVKLERILLTLSKFVTYSLIILASFLIEKNVSPVIPWLQAISGIMIVHEVKSTGKVFAKIYGVNFFDAIKDYIVKAGPKITLPAKESEEKENE